MAGGMNFLDIPTEIRELIYKELFTGVTVGCGYPKRISRDSDPAPSQNFLTAIFETCHACHEEAKPIFLATVCFRATDPASVSPWHEALAAPPYPGSVLLLPLPLLGKADDLHHVRHLQVPNLIKHKADIPTSFPNLKTLRIVGEVWCQKNVICLGMHKLVDVLSDGVLKEFCQEEARLEVSGNKTNWAVGRPEASFSIGPPPYTTAGIMYLERNEHNKRYKIFQHVVVWVDMPLMDGDSIQELEFVYDMDTGIATFDEEALSAWYDDVKLSLPKGILEEYDLWRTNYTSGVSE